MRRQIRHNEAEGAPAHVWHMNNMGEIAARVEHRLGETLDTRIDKFDERDRPDHRLAERDQLCERPIRRAPANEIDHRHERDDPHARKVERQVLPEYPLGEAQRPLDDKRRDDDGDEHKQPVDKAARDTPHRTPIDMPQLASHRFCPLSFSSGAAVSPPRQSRSRAAPPSCCASPCAP